MNCKHARQAIRSLICGDKSDVRLIEQHLTRCSRCNEKARPFLEIVRSFKEVPVPQLNEDAWREFSAKLRARMEQEQPTPLGRWRSLLLSAGQWNTLRFRKAFAASLVAIALVGSLLAVLPGFWSNDGLHDTVAWTPAFVPPLPPPELPPAAMEAISIFGDVGFISGVFSGYIQPGDFFGGDELGADDIVEALDFLLS